jgi:hypothetical protein
MYTLPFFLDDVKKYTGLATEEVLVYNIFARDASLSGGIIDHNHVQYELGDFLEKATGQALTSLGKKEQYRFWEDRFSDKSLLQQIVQENGTINLTLTGYNPYDDTKYYMKYRIKGTTLWTGRMPRNTYILEKSKYVKDYEFQEMIN